MAITSTLNTPLSFSTLRSEFKRTTSGSIGLSELYRDGLHVPNEVFYHANKIPTASLSTIRVSNFYGTTRGENGTAYFNANPASEIILSTLPTDVDRVRIVLIGGGGAGKMRYHGTSAEVWLAGGAGGFIMGYFYGLQALGAQYGRSNLKITVQSSGGGGPVIWSANATQDAPYGPAAASSASQGRVTLEQLVNGVWQVVHTLSVGPAPGVTGNGGTFTGMAVGSYNGGKGFVVNNTSPSPPQHTISNWNGATYGFAVENSMNGGDATGGDGGTSAGAIKFAADGTDPYTLISPAILGGQNLNYTIVGNGLFPALRVSDYGYGGTFIAAKWINVTRPYFENMQPAQASGQGYLRVQY